MTSLEIVLLLIGLVCVVVSFIMGQDKIDTDQRITTELNLAQKEAIRKQVQAIIDEEVITASEKTEVSLDKISNTKILEMNEYAENVLGQINRNHNETVFLYDMLNEKAKEVKTTVKDVNVTRRQVEKIQAEVANDVYAATREGQSQQSEEKIPESALLGRSQVDSLERDVAGTALVDEDVKKMSEKTAGSKNVQQRTQGNKSSGTKASQTKPSTQKSAASEKPDSEEKTTPSKLQKNATIVKPGAATKPVAGSGAATRKKKQVSGEEEQSQHSRNVAKERIRKVVEADETALGDMVDPSSMSEEDKMDAALQAAKDGKKVAAGTTKRSSRRFKTESSLNAEADDMNVQQEKKSNNNEKILKMFREGKSGRDIAKELNLGVGEVKLVIDLYNSTK